MKANKIDDSIKTIAPNTSTRRIIGQIGFVLT